MTEEHHAIPISNRTATDGNRRGARVFGSARLLRDAEHADAAPLDLRGGLQNVALFTVLVLTLGTVLQALFGHTFLTVALALSVAYALLVGGVVIGLLCSAGVFALLMAVHFVPHWIPELRSTGLVALLLEFLSATVVLLVAAGLELRRQIAVRAREARSRLDRQITLMQQILDTLGPPMFVALLDEEGVIQEANQRLLEASGADRDMVVGQRFSETSWWSGETARATVRGTVGQGLQGQASRFDIQAQMSEGPIWVDLSMEPLYAEDGRVRYLVASGTAVDERKKAEQRLGSVVEAVPTVLVMVNRQGVIQLANDHVRDLFGYRREELLGTPIDRLLPPDIREHHKQLISGYFRDPRPRMMGAGRDLYGQHADGRQIPIEIGLSPITEGEELYVLAAISDISERMAARKELEDLASHLDTKVRERTEALEASNARWQQRNLELLAVNEMSGLITACDDEQELASLAATYQQRLFPDSSGAVYLEHGESLRITASWGDDATFTDAIAHEDCWALRRGHTHIVQGRSPDLICPHVHVPETTIDPGFMVCAPLRTGYGTVGLLHVRIGPSDDDSEQMRASAELLLQGIAEHMGLALANLRMRRTLQDQAIRDPLTGLYNRRYLDSTAGRMLAQTRRYGQPLSVLVADIDRFKVINDTAGHDVGDLVLSRIAALMTQELRDADLLCRYGGEEFVLVLPDTDLQRAADAAERIRVAIEQVPMADRIRVTVSLGVATYDVQDSALPDIITRADEAMYRAKQEGGNRVCLADQPCLKDEDTARQTGESATNDGAAG